MAKGSGNTRTQRPARVESSSESGVSAAQFYTLVNSIANDKGEIDYRVLEKLDNDQRELALMESGFTGMTSEDDFEMGNLYIPRDKKTMSDMLIESLVNTAMGYSSNDETFHIGYKDGKNITADDIDLSDIKPNWTWRSIEGRVRSKLQIQNVDFILNYNPISQPMYWVKESGKAHFKEYGGFEEWKEGRGEKRRDYIQDDWI